MRKIDIIDNDNNIIQANLIFSFYCKETMKTYIALDLNKNIFQQNSQYNNLDILEITKEISNQIYVKNIPDSDWEIVKNSIQNEIFSNLN